MGVVGHLPRAAGVPFANQRDGARPIVVLANTFFLRNHAGSSRAIEYERRVAVRTRPAELRLRLRNHMALSRMRQHHVGQTLQINLPTERAGLKHLHARRIAAPPHGVAGGANERRAIDRARHPDRVKQLLATWRKRNRETTTTGRFADQLDTMIPRREEPGRRGAGRTAAEHDHGRRWRRVAEAHFTSASNASVMTWPARFTCTKNPVRAGLGNLHGNDTVAGGVVACPAC